MADDSESASTSTDEERAGRTAPAGVSVRLAGAADEQGATDLFQLVFDHWPPWDVPVEPVEFLRWVMGAQTPHGGVLVVAEEGSRIVGALLGIQRPLRLNGRERWARVDFYVAVHPDMRRQGINSALQTGYPEGYEMEWSFTQVDLYVQQRARRGEEPIRNPLSTFVLVLDSWRAGGGRRMGARPLNAAAYLMIKLRGALQRRSSDGERAWDVRVVEEFDERVDEFWEAASKPYALIPGRSREYLNWRFCDPRGGLFTVLIAEQDGELLGYAALRMVDRRGHIADLLALPGREDVVRSLLDESVQELRSQGAAAVECTMMLHHSYASELRRAGFVLLSNRSAEMTRKFGAEWRDIPESDVLPATGECSAVHVMLADSDLI